jgi:hydrogenase maturation protein HypF
MRLEALCDKHRSPIVLPLLADDNDIWRTDWAPLLAMLADHRLSRNHRAEIFHSSVAHALLAQAKLAREACGATRVGLTGGVFQNRVLAAEAVELLTAAGFEVHLPQALPCNDAALCFGQIIEFAADNRR